MLSCIEHDSFMNSRTGEADQDHSICTFLTRYDIKKKNELFKFNSSYDDFNTVDSRYLEVKGTL